MKKNKEVPPFHVKKAEPLPEYKMVKSTGPGTMWMKKGG